jgi:hypothetical protein
VGWGVVLVGIGVFHFIRGEFGNHIELVGYEINKERIKRGEELKIVWKWRYLRKSKNIVYFMWTRIVDQWGNPVAVMDRKLVPKGKEIVCDTAIFTIPEKWKKGRYGILVLGGIYFDKNSKGYLPIKPKKGLRIYRKKSLVVGRLVVK